MTWILGGGAAVSLVLAMVFFSGYSSVLSYVKTTLEEPESPPAWDARALSPEECVDAALTWAEECQGIKSMCDMYVDHVMALCLGSQDRSTYCAAVEDTTATTRFGHGECGLRGTRRNVDAEACANAYRAIASYCATGAAASH